MKIEWKLWKRKQEYVDNNSLIKFINVVYPDFINSTKFI